MPKPILIIQLRPEDKASDSEFNAILRSANLKRSNVVRIRGETQSFKNINLDKYSAIIVGGSPFDVTTPEHEKSQTQKRVEKDFQILLSSVVPRDFPFLGACSGNGQLSVYAQGKMSRKYAEPVSGVDVFITKEGQKDKLLHGFPKKFRALVGHKEACEIPPPNAVLLAYSKTCPTQMMRIGKNVYSTQFHPEADAAEFELRIKIYKNYGYFPPEEAEKLIAQIQNEKVVWPSKVLQNFVNVYYRNL